jgi:hypothetical protein
MSDLSEVSAMLEIEPVELGITLPDGPVGMVLMQPHVRFAQPPCEPFRWDSSMVDQQIAAIGRTLEVATHPIGACGHAAFTVFPEYAIPGPEGVRAIDEAIRGRSWPKNSVVIGGVDGLNKQQYTQLANEPKTSVHGCNACDRIQDHEWVNCCITWAPDNDGVVRRWIQPKIRPAWHEVNTRYQSMFKGSAVFVFAVTYGGQRYPCRFFTLLCFDWVTRTSNWQEVVTRLQQSWGHDTKFLHWIFVLQRNVKPNAHSFLDSTYEFLTTTVDPSVDRRDAAIILSNVAAGPVPCRRGDGGFSAVVFGPQAPFDCRGCRPTVCTYPTKLRRADKLRRLKDSVFREMGPCLHSFTLRIPRFIQPDATDRHEPVENAEVYSLNDRSDPRTPDGPVPAIVKWVNDELDDLRCYAARVAPVSDDVRDRTNERHGSCVNEYRGLDGPMLQNRMDYGVASKTETEGLADASAWCPDLWETAESEALAHQIHTLSLLRAACDVNIAGATLHGTLMNNGKPVEVVAICGSTHAEVLAHAKTQLRGVNHCTIIISRDSESSHTNPQELKRFTDIGESENRETIQFTDPVGGWRVRDFASCRDVWQSAADEAAMKESIRGVLGLR